MQDEWVDENVEGTRCSRREVLTLSGRSGISEAMNASAGKEELVTVRYLSIPATLTHALLYWGIFIKRLGYLGHCLMFIALFIAEFFVGETRSHGGDFCGDY